MKELWKDIKDFEGFYQISNLGIIKSLSRTANTYYGSRHVRERVLKQNPDKDGYLTVCFSKNNKIKKIKIHRLVATYFVDNPNKLPQVDHIDENKTNNADSNLRWVVNLQNTNNYHSKNGTKKYGIHLSSGRWRSRIKKDGKSISLGFFTDKEEAYQAFYDKYLELHGVKPW